MPFETFYKCFCFKQFDKYKRYKKPKCKHGRETTFDAPFSAIKGDNNRLRYKALACLKAGRCKYKKEMKFNTPGNSACLPEYHIKPISSKHIINW